MSGAMRLAAVACALMWMGCIDSTLQELERSVQDHVLSRAGYGPDAWSRQRVLELGIPGYLLEQLDPASLDDAAYEALEAAYPRLALRYDDLIQEEDDWRIRQDLAEARVLRAIHSRRQLEAVLLDFWFDHFNVYADDGLAVYDVIPYERRAILPHVLGRFEDMLVAVAQSPAMLDYLDNDENSRFGINENYGRELLELHTVSVDGGYTELDVVETARAFTGWTTVPEEVQSETGFLYRSEWHDTGPKTVMGLELTSGGMQDGLDVLHHLATHPRTAEHISRKLVVRFVSEAPHEALVADLAALFLASDGDLREVTTALLLSREFLFEPGNARSKVKRPLVLMASLARALGSGGPAAAEQITEDLEDLGEGLYLARPPSGYPDASEYWAGNGTLLGRFEIFRRVASGSHALQITLGESGTPAELADALSARLFPLRAVSAHTRATAIAYLEGLPAWAQRDRGAAEMLAMLLSSPEFLTH